MLPRPRLGGPAAANGPTGDTASEIARQARQMIHALNNDFTVVMGSLELVQASPELPGHVHTLLTAAREQMTLATERLDAFQRIARAQATDA
jgi:hypothetical protein